MSAPIKAILLSIAELLLDSNTAAAGFTWESGEVSYDPHKNRQKVSLGEAPHVKVTDVALFEANFPGVILRALDGTSIKVASQAVTRRALLRDRKTAWTDMQTAVLQSLRGMKSRAAVIVRKVYSWGGKDFANAEEQITFMRETLAAKGKSEEFIDEVIADAFPELNEELEEISEEVTE